MSRGDGFDVADTDTGMLADPKVLALARRLHDSLKTGAAIALYDAVRLASWRAGRRLTLNETAPGWWLEPFDDLAAALVAVGLLDDERRIPDHAWQSWFGPAYNRRDYYRELGARGGKAKAAHMAESTDALPNALPNALPRTVPTVSPDSTVPTDWRDFGPEWDDFKEAWTGKGLRLPPKGMDGERDSQRAMLWEIVSARPNDAVRWCREAKGKSSWDIVGHILAQWSRVKEASV